MSRVEWDTGENMHNKITDNGQRKQRKGIARPIFFAMLLITPILFNSACRQNKDIMKSSEKVFRMVQPGQKIRISPSNIKIEIKDTWFDNKRGDWSANANIYFKNQLVFDGEIRRGDENTIDGMGEGIVFSLDKVNPNGNVDIKIKIG